MTSGDFINEWLETGALVSSDKGKVLLGWGVPEYKERCDDSLLVPQFYFPTYFLSDTAPWRVYPNYSEMKISQLVEMLESEGLVSSPSLGWDAPQKEPFNQAFHDLQRRFRGGELKKGVPYAIQTNDSTMVSRQLRCSLVSVLNYASRSPVYAYGFWDKDEGMLGATPETLFVRCGHKTVETMACAGTAHSGRNLEQFLTDPKELYEHKLVIDDIFGVLNPYGSLTVGETQPVPFGKLHHMVTPIKLELSTPFQFDELVRALHPTAALGAFPRERGMEWLKGYERMMPRGRFGAPAGVVYNEHAVAVCYVAIRNVQWSCKGMKLFAGCGVVPESQCDNEWNEIKGKMQTIREVLSI